MRRAQQNLQPPTTKRGDPAVADVLWRALEDTTIEFNDDVPHGFHSWPAGTPPAIARTLLDDFVRGPGDVVVDPFCGGGTVGLEALLHKLPFVGVDLNPLSQRVGFQRCRPRSDGDAAGVGAIVDAITERSKDRVRAKQRVRAEVPPDIAAAYLPHTLAELAGLVDEIIDCDDENARKLMAVCFSAILTKVSQRRGDTGRTDGEPKRVARFFPSETFQQKAHELLDRQRALFRKVGLDVPRPRFVEGDARDLATVVDVKADLVITSPPYGGTYDYSKHHAHRIAWLGLDDSKLQQLEIGARRRQNRRGEFDDEVRAMLVSITGVLSENGRVVLLMGDGVVDGKRRDAAQHVEEASAAADLVVIASAAAPRSDWHGGPDRREHLIALRRR